MVSIKSNYVSDLMTLGIGRDVVSSKKNPLDYCTATKYGSTSLSIKDQKEIFLSTIDKPLSKNYIYFIISNGGVPIFAKLAAAIMCQSVKELDARNRIAWHRVTGGRYDSLLQRDGTKFLDPDFIVLSLISPNSDGVKLENAHDILDRWSWLPRVVVFNSTTIEDSINMLHLKPNRILNLGSKPKMTSI